MLPENTGLALEASVMTFLLLQDVKKQNKNINPKQNKTLLDLNITRNSGY